MSNFNYAEPWSGRTSSVVTSDEFALPRLINSFRVVNKESSSIAVNVYLVGSIYNISVMPNNHPLDANEMYESAQPILVTTDDRIRVQSSGAVDFNFTLSNVNP